MTALRVRPPAVAGSFYPADPDTLRATIEEALQGAASSQVTTARPPKAVVVPHAGYVYSAPVAASAYARLLPSRGQVERVLLLGPAHRTALAAIAASSSDAFETPLGLVRVDRGTRDALVTAALVVLDDRAHAGEHSLEVQLPFLQVVLGEVAVLPLAVGQVPAEAVRAVLDKAWGGSETLVVVSTDLSHYHDHATAQELDRRTAEAVLATQPEALAPGDACGVFPLRGLLAAARRRNLAVELVDLRTSADTAGDPDRVVGYGAFLLREPEPGPPP